MRSLLLLRHAKSSWDDPALDDFDRPLAERGLRDAPVMGAEIARRGWKPDFVLVSTALRAQQTWILASAAFGDSPEPTETRFEQELYMAEARAILDLLRTAPEIARCILVIGHNPGMENFALSLCSPESRQKPLERMIRKFPTAALARFTLEQPWSELQTGTARLTHFLRVKDLG
jgi:phosphohistidine phosphatase